MRLGTAVAQAADARPGAQDWTIVSGMAAM
jgi:hypothetical protein